MPRLNGRRDHCCCETREENDGLRDECRRRPLAVGPGCAVGAPGSGVRPDRDQVERQALGAGDDGAFGAAELLDAGRARGRGRGGAVQHLLSRAAWDEGRVRSEIRAWACEHLGTTAGPRVLAVDETGDLKKGDATVGVQRQYSETAGRIENCQIAVYLAYATAAGHAAVDVRLYLPRAWTDDRHAAPLPGCPNRSASPPSPSWPGS